MEPLGAVSSVFAVVSLALQLCSNIQNLIEFWDSVKEAPDEITQITSQLRILGELLRCVELDTHGAKKDSTADIGIQCLQVCNTSILKLERVSKELDKGLNGNGVRRRWTCLRKALREKELAAYWDEIERAKSMLIIYQGWKNGQRHDALLTMMTTLLPTGAESSIASGDQELQIFQKQQIRRNRSGFTNTFLGSTTYEIRMSFGTFRVRMSTHITKSKDIHLSTPDLIHMKRQQQISVSFIPGFFLSSVFEWTLSRGYCPQMTVKYFNLRPGWSPIFKYSAQGDMGKVRQLIEDGLASPNDVDEDGWTPLHYASSCHKASLCIMLIYLGAATNSVTQRQETPLQLAAKREHLTARYHGAYRRDQDASSVDTVRVLIEQGNNDPMQVDDIGYTSIMTAAAETKNAILPWLLHQDEYELDLKYRNPAGHTAAAYISTREDFPELLQPLLQRGSDVKEPCSNTWSLRFGPRVSLGAPSMIHYAVWTWYSKLLGTSDSRLPYGRKSTDSEFPFDPRPTLRSLLDHGANLHDQTTLGYTVLDGMCLNLLQFDGYARSHRTRACAFRTWLNIVQELGFDIREYIRRERDIHDGISHDLGLGLTLEISFRIDPDPWAWSVFQGPEERERGDLVNHIASCSVWPEWERRFATPKPPPPWPATLLVWNPDAMVVLQSLDSPKDASETASRDTDNDFPRKFEQLDWYFPIICWKVRHYALMGARYRVEFSFYFAAIIALLGFGYFSRIWTTWIFYTSLKIAGYAFSC